MSKTTIAIVINGYKLEAERKRFQGKATQNGCPVWVRWTGVWREQPFQLTLWEETGLITDGNDPGWASFLEDKLVPAMDRPDRVQLIELLENLAYQQNLFKTQEQMEFEAVSDGIGP